MNNGKIRIPRDIEEYIGKKRALHIVGFVVTDLAFLAMFIALSDAFFGDDYSALSYVLAVGVMVLPIYWFKLPFLLFDKTFVGEIIHKSEEDYIVSDENKTVTTGRLRVNRRQDLMIKCDDGKIIHYTVYDNRAQHAFRGDMYGVGDRVIHVGGTNYLQAVHTGNGATLICTVCGAESLADTHVCHVCGKTLKID